eukprot:1158752-Pelagomonas_calceolata.AAC.5
MGWGWRNMGTMEAIRGNRRQTNVQLGLPAFLYFGKLCHMGPELPVPSSVLKEKRKPLKYLC